MLVKTLSFACLKDFSHSPANNFNFLNKDKENCN